MFPLGHLALTCGAFRLAGRAVYGKHSGDGADYIARAVGALRREGRLETLIREGRLAICAA